MKYLMISAIFGAFFGIGQGYTQDKLWISVRSTCKIHSSKLYCEIDQGLIKVRIECTTQLVDYNGSEGKRYFCSEQGKMTITSSMPIRAIKSSGLKRLSDNQFKTQVSQRMQVVSIPNEHSKVTIRFGSNYYSSISHIAFDELSNASVDNIVGFFQNSKIAFVEILKHTLRYTQDFQGEIAASHQGHLDRYLQSLNDCIAVSEDERNYSILDWRIQECSRRIVVFGIVLNELLNDYGHVDRLQAYITAIDTLTKSLRKSYGWDRGLAGTASKASGALLEVIKFELQEILSIKISSGATNFEQYLALIQDLTKLIAKINASRAGDLVVQRYIWSLVDTWNSEGWQNELSLLIGAPVDEKKLVLPKLQLLLMAVESLNDLVNVNFKVPNLD